MRTHSYFLKSGKGTYGLGHTQITTDDVYVNFRPPNNDLALELLRENTILARQNQLLQETVFYNRVFITNGLQANFSNNNEFREHPIYFQTNGTTRLIVDTTRIQVDFRNTTVFIKNSNREDILPSGNRRFKITGDAQPAYGNYVWYACNYVPSTPYAFDNLGSFMPNNALWFLAYQREQPVALPNASSNDDVYSLDEVETNKVWIDGDRIYRKVLDFGTFINDQGRFSLEHNLSIDTYISFQVFAPSQDVKGLFVPETSGDSLILSRQSLLFNTNMTLTSGDYLIIEYTKGA